jgi:stage II sporulation protein D
VRAFGSSGTAATVAAVTTACLALGASCRTLPRARPAVLPVAQAQAPAEAAVPPPVLRVGVQTEAPRVSLGADSGLVLWGVDAQGAAGRSGEVQRATFVMLSPASASRIFRVQVGSFAAQPAAQTAADRAEELSGQRPSIAWSGETQTHQVRVGEYASRDEARELAGRLVRSGVTGAFVVEEGQPAGGLIRLLETGQAFRSVTVRPAQPKELLSLDGQPYRGLFEVRANDAGNLTVVNVVNLEDYLRGVVPSELSPVSFPQIEALKAQAVAARTYALRNRGQFQDRGYDICATPTCQVYKGQAAEQPLSDRAVHETQGIAAYYRGAFINALYTSTCGGHTEDGEKVFEGQPSPYLRGVACAAEREPFESLRTLAPTRPIGREPGLNRDAGLLVALGVLDPGLASPGALDGPVTDPEIRAWTSRLVAGLKRRGCSSEVEGPLGRRASLFRFVVESLCWQERAQRLLAPGDPEYLLQVDDRSGFSSDAERLAAALLVQEGVIGPFADNTLRPTAPATRAQAVAVLARAALRVGPPTLLTGEFKGSGGGRLLVHRGDADESFPVDGGARLFRSFDGTPAAASELILNPGDKLSFMTTDGRVTFLEAEQSRLGTSADRDSRFYRWEVRLTPQQVAEGVARYGDPGSVKDVVPRALGVSGRVVELAVVGSRGEVVLKGLKIRTALGLRENLFVLDRELDPAGQVKQFIFTGKGWGHGVGLCQVGSSGLAQTGATYEQILKHYYTGINLDRAYE